MQVWQKIKATHTSLILRYCRLVSKCLFPVSAAPLSCRHPSSDTGARWMPEVSMVPNDCKVFQRLKSTMAAFPRFKYVQRERLDQSSCTTVCVHCGTGCVLVLRDSHPFWTHRGMPFCNYRIVFQCKMKGYMLKPLRNDQCTTGKHNKMTYRGWKCRKCSTHCFFLATWSGVHKKCTPPKSTTNPTTWKPLCHFHA